MTWYLIIFKCPVNIPCTCVPIGLKSKSLIFLTLYEWKSKFWFSVWRYKVRDLFFQSSYFAYLTQFICVKCLSFGIITLNLKKEIFSLFCFTNVLRCLKLEIVWLASENVIHVFTLADSGYGQSQENTNFGPNLLKL